MIFNFIIFVITSKKYHYYCSEFSIHKALCCKTVVCKLISQKEISINISYHTFVNFFANDNEINIPKALAFSISTECSILCDQAEPKIIHRRLSD